MMTSSNSQKVLCATCNKASGMFICRGCDQNFCTRHVGEHRQELGRQMDELTVDHDRFRQNLSEHMKDVQLHPLMKQIDQWEQESIEKIRRSADKTRQDLRKIIDEHLNQLLERLAKVAEELRKAREDEEYFETDLKQWIEKLDQLKKDFTQPPNIELDQNNDIINTITIRKNVSETVLVKETFGRSLGDVDIIDNGQVIVKTKTNAHATIRGNGEYSGGKHQFHFQVEKYLGSKWIFFGIISKNVELQNESRYSRSCYGWAGANQAHINGKIWNQLDGYESDIEENDIVQLTLDCNRRIIQLKNERTKSIYEITVELDKCPFPWQLNINMYHCGDRLRILH